MVKKIFFGLPKAKLIIITTLKKTFCIILIKPLPVQFLNIYPKAILNYNISFFAANFIEWAAKMLFISIDYKIGI
jgi:hypothetical protein